MSNVLVRVGTFIIGGSATWCILPIVTEQELHGTATGYGVLLGCIGSGAVLGAFLLAKFRQRFSPDQIVIAAGILWGLATLSLGFVKSFPLASLAMFAGGVAWVSETSSFNVAAQTVLPAWVRARALSVYLLVFQGGMAISSVVWGSLADRYGIRTSFIVAGTVLLLTPLLAKWFPLREGEERDGERERRGEREPCAERRARRAMIARADRLRRDRLDRERHTQRWHHQREDQVVAERDARELVLAHPTDERGVDDAHRHHAQLSERDRAREPQILAYFCADERHRVTRR